MASFTKAPDGVLDFSLDWSLWLPDGEAITATAWRIEPNDGSLVIDSEIVDGLKRGVVLSGGTFGWIYKAVCKITTDQNNTAERSVAVRIMEK